jgi:hypothetical protein
VSMHRMWKVRQHTHFLAVCELTEADGTDVGGDRGCPIRAIDLYGDAPERAFFDPSYPAGPSLLSCVGARHAHRMKQRASESRTSAKKSVNSRATRIMTMLVLKLASRLPPEWCSARVVPPPCSQTPIDDVTQ